MTPEFEPDFNIYRVRRITLRIEKVLAGEFADERTGEVITGLFLHAIIAARDSLGLPVQNQHELVDTLNRIVDQCEGELQKPPTRRPGFLQRFRALLWRNELKRNVSKTVDRLVEQATVVKEKLNDSDPESRREA
jgi:hypothetical protein